MSRITTISKNGRMAVTAEAIRDNNLSPGDALQYIGTTDDGILQYIVVLNNTTNVCRIFKDNKGEYRVPIPKQIADNGNLKGDERFEVNVNERGNLEVKVVKRNENGE